MTEKTYTTLRVIVGIMFLFLCYYSYLSFFPFKTLIVKGATVEKSIHAGDVLYYTVDYCKYTDKPATVFRTLHSVDEKILVPFPSVVTISVPGCNQATIPLRTFPEIKPGTYYVLVDAVFEMSGQRKIHVIFKTDKFEIL